MGKISLMLVDDHPLFRQGLRRVLEAEPDMEVIIEVAEGDEALRMAKESGRLADRDAFHGTFRRRSHPVSFSRSARTGSALV